MYFFRTSPEVIARSTLAVLQNLFSFIDSCNFTFQMAFMKTGALKRVIIFMKTIASEDKAVQIMMLLIGTLMVAVGATQYYSSANSLQWGILLMFQ